MALVEPSALQGVSDRHNRQVASLESHSHTTADNAFLVPREGFAAMSRVVQRGDDLHIEGADGTVITIPGYFLFDPPAVLLTADGDLVDPSFIQAVTRLEAEGQLAQAGSTAVAGTPIGILGDLTGEAFAVRPDGTRVALKEGDPVFRGDVVETTAGATARVTFVDEATLVLSAGARLSLNAYTFDPQSGTGSSVFVMLDGVYRYTAGAAQEGGATVLTPSATMDVRGGTVVGEVDATGVDSRVTLLSGTAVVATQAGAVTLDQPFATTAIASASEPPAESFRLSAPEVAALYGDVAPTGSGGAANLDDIATAAGPPTGEGNPGAGGTLPVPGIDSPFRLDPSNVFESAPLSPQPLLVPPPPVLTSSISGRSTPSADENNDEEGGGDTVGAPPQQISSEPIIEFTGGGFKIIGEAAGDLAGGSVSSAGDVNGDGIDDIVIGSFVRLIDGRSTGAAYVVFGSTSNNSKVHLDDVALGTGGFKITGEAPSDLAGVSVSSAGDVNNDGIDDLIIGASLNATGGMESGAAYVVFGTTSNVLAVKLDDVALGIGGFKVTGEEAFDFAGAAVSSAGDINGDGVDDFLLGAYGNDIGISVVGGPPSSTGNVSGESFDGFRTVTVGSVGSAGAAYVVFGTASDVSAVNLDDIALGTGGFKITGEVPGERTGISVSSAGDVNGDGIDDLLIGTTRNAGASYVVFGTTSDVPAVNLVDVASGTGGFKITGEVPGERTGISVSSAGDVNGDGIDDLIIGSSRELLNGTRPSTGAAYVIFGTTSNVSAVNLDDVASGVGGFKITGEELDDFAGVSVSSAGDINGDGIDDLLVGARGNDFGGSSAGAAYVIFGTTSRIAAVNLNDVSQGTGGFRVTGEASSDSAGGRVSAAGDVNGDGFDDILVGARSNDEGGSNAGAAYVLFGFDVTALGTASDETLIGTAGADILIGGLGEYVLIGNGGADVLRGGAGDDEFFVSDDTFARVDGGRGNDVLALQRSCLSLDLTAIGDTRITGIETLDLIGRGSNNTLALAATDVAAMSDTRTLTVLGDDTDVLTTTDFWVDGGAVNVSGQSFLSFTLDGKRLLVDPDIDISGLLLQRFQFGTAGADTLIGSAGVDVMDGGPGDDVLIGNGGADELRGGAGDDVLRIGNDFLGRFDGGVGDDVLALQNFGLSLDLTAIGDTRITGIETIDLTGSGSNNPLILAATDVTALTDNDTLTVLGGDTDAVVTTDFWVDDGTAFVSGQNFLSFSLDGARLLIDPDIDISGLRLQGLPLGDLDGTNGFKIIGQSEYDQAGGAVSSAGDINGDGLDDLIVGAKYYNDGFYVLGAAYVIFGTASGVSEIDLDAISLGSGGFQIIGEASRLDTGVSVSSAGDVNGDGIDDVIVGTKRNAGAAYVVFGAESGITSVDLGDVAVGSGGFKIVGENGGDLAGSAVSDAGDVNGDGIDDIIVGAPGNNASGSGSSVGAGAAYVVFGSATMPSSVDLSNIAAGVGGFKIKGESVNDNAGSGVGAAGDINGDGIDDLVVGATRNDAGAYGTGAAYVVFGSTAIGSSIDLDVVAQGTGGFKIVGEAEYDYAGRSVSSAGDVNGDGIDDLIVGADRNNGGGANSGAAYVIFGGASPPTTVALSDVASGTGGFKINGEIAFDLAGRSVSSAGDVNGDGFDDLIVGAKSSGSGGIRSGAAYVVFGSATPSSVDLEDVARGIGSFKVAGEAAGDAAGVSVDSAGDVDGDGFDDVIVGANGNDSDGISSGAAYVVFGGDITGDVTSLGTSDADTLSGSAATDVMIGGLGDDILIGEGGADVLRGGAGDDGLFVSDGAFRRIAGGLGTDTLFLSDGAGLDLTVIGDTRISGVEATGFDGAGQSTLTVAATDVRAMSDTGTLTVANNDGNPLSLADDTLVLAGGWTFAGTADGFHRFANGATALRADVSALSSTASFDLDITDTVSLDFANATDRFSVNGRIDIVGDNTLTINTGTLEIEAGALFDFGSGAVAVGTGAFVNNGTFDGGASPGTVFVDGDLAWGASANMLIELGGLTPGAHDGFDQLRVSGQLDLAGTANLVEFGAFEVDVGDSFQIVAAGQLSRSFDQIVGRDVGGGVVLEAAQSATGVTLSGRAVTHQGDAGDNILTGGAGDDAVLGGAGDDVITGNGGRDLLFGGDGDDLFVASDVGFGHIDGGGGFDVVELSGSGRRFDLTGLRGDQIDNIEAIDFSGEGDNVLVLDDRLANAATGGENALIIDGDTGDVVEAGGNWEVAGTVTIGNEGYTVFASNANDAQIYVDSDVSVNVA